MEMPTELFPVPPLEFPVPDPPLPAPAVPLGDAPDAPGLPSGEIATRAARFPCGTGITGPGGAGFAESAISVDGAEEFAAPGSGTSGAPPLSPVCVRSATRGAEDGLICNFGFAGPLVEVAMLSAAVCCSRFASSGVGASVVVADFAALGCNFASVFSLISMRGRAGACDEAISTTLGMAGRNLGASAGAAGLIRVCRGWFG